MENGEAITTRSVAVISENGYFSQLPESLMDHVLFYLPPKYMARLASTSKTWNRVFTSLPIYNFAEHYCSSLIKGEESYEDFVMRVDHSLSPLRKHKVRIEEFILHVDNRDSGFDNQVDEWIGLVAENNYIEQLDLCFSSLPYDLERKWFILPQAVFFAESLCFLSLQACKVVGSTLRDGIRFPRLKALFLVYVCLDEQIILDLLLGCPSLEGFIVDCCPGLDNLQIPNLSKLEKVRIGLEGRIDRIEASNVQCLYCTAQLLDLNAIACNDVRTLCIHSDITDQFIEELLAKFHLLEDLTLVSSASYQKISISSHQLKHLSLEVKALAKLEIDAPNLVCYSYTSLSLPDLYFINTSSSTVARLQLSVRENLDANWFLNLGTYLQLFNKHETLVLRIKSFENSFYQAELRDTSTFRQSNLEHLKISGITLPILDHAALLDGFLWILRPRSLSVQCPWRNIEFVMFLCETLTEVVEDLEQAFSLDISSWRHSLKAAEVKCYAKGDQSEVFSAKNFLQSLSNIQAYEQLTFELEW